MTAKAKSLGLGRGLSALMGDMEDDVTVAGAGRGQSTLPVAWLSANPFQPRRSFDPEALAELVESIREKGILQPILVRPTADRSRYEIIAGERRWRAAQAAAIHEIPVMIREFTDQEALEAAIIENVQREDLSAVEEAKGYRQLMDDFDHTQEEVSQLVGKSRSHIANLLRLLTLPEPVQLMIDSGRLSMGHARALIGADDAVSLAKRVEESGLSVRQTESLARGRKGKSSRPSFLAPTKDADTLALERDLSRALGLKVSISHAGEQGGQVAITYKTLEQLDDLCQRLCGP